MPITELRILPPYAIGRFGSSSTPLEAYQLKISEEGPLHYREIEGKETFEIDEATGEIARCYIPEKGSIRFKDANQIRPVCPFLEVFAVLNNDSLVPLTLGLLNEEGLSINDLQWKVQVANLKVFRQTEKEDDKILAGIDKINDHNIHELVGKCKNFLPNKSISFGFVRFIKPTNEFPEIRLRFTPAQGLVFGSSLTRFVPAEGKEVPDEVFKDFPERIMYDSQKGTWHRFQADEKSNTLPNPSDIYQGYWPPEDDKLPIGWGYMDDVCDGPVSVELKLKDGSSLKATSWISSCMPAFAPDSQPMRTVADELEQLILGPEVNDEEVSIEAAAEIIRRALETIRLMNTRAMNANIIDGRANIASTLYRQDSNDYGRYYAPGMASSLVDNLAVRALHERIYAALISGTAPWFAEVLRRPEEVGDMSDKARRKMPPMLRGADGRALTLTRRQISKIVKAATINIFK